MHIKDKWFIDSSGRRLMLRGVNLGGSSKVPVNPNGATHLPEHFFEHKDVSFTGRPFPLSEADEHFTRLRSWGFNFLRFLITWEAIEHAGPGIYDQEYLDYISAILEKAGEYGFNLFIDPHQDVWSRFTGGDGAPGWTLEAAGFEPRNFFESGAATTHQMHGDPFPWMTWPTNNDKLACATMFTLFFGGNDFAPATLIDGEPVQEYLQRHYINSILQVVERTRNMQHVIGYDTLNEPEPGWIGVKDLRKCTSVRSNGPAPTPWESILMGAGHPQNIEIRKLGTIRFSRERKLLNTGKVRAWQEGRECVWRQNGVWDIDSNGNPQLPDPGYFSSVNGRKVNFFNDYLKPFVNRYASAVRQVHPDAVIFIDPPYMSCEFNWDKADDVTNVAYAPHWYDGATMVFKSYKPWLAVDTRNLKIVLSPPLVRRSLASQLRHYQYKGHSRTGNLPVIIGEMGIPYDMHNAEAYRNGDFSNQRGAFNRCLHAVETTLSNVTIWNYTSDNNNERGDQWNGEDFSIFSRDQQTDSSDINSGGRALEVLLRPYPVATAGIPISLNYNVGKRLFHYKFRHDPATSSSTVIHVPSYKYPQGFNVTVSDGLYEIHTESQTVEYSPGSEYEIHEISISPV